MTSIIEVIKTADKEKIVQIQSCLNFEKKMYEKKLKKIESLNNALKSRRQQICVHKWVYVCEYGDRYTYCRLCECEK